MNHYRLPRQQFKCGNSPTGAFCPLGPIRGRCSQSHADPTLVCRPLRTLDWWSRSIQVSVTLVALIGVSLAWSNFGNKQTLAPGPLSRSHAQLLISVQSGIDGPHGIDSASRCDSCHPGNDTASPATKQSDLCLKCHVQEMPDAVHGSPHDLHGKSLAELVANGDRRETKSNWSQWLGRSPIAWKENATECSQCHREHQGSSHDLKEMTSTRCQACHREQFHSFSTNHPEFKNYPYGRTKSIAFDHVKHRDLHFSKKAANFDCKVCHVQSDQVGVVGQVFRSVPFEQACASCHKEPIQSAIQEGLIVLQIPSLNRKELMGNGTDIGDWPTQASQLTDGIIPPIMRLLIESEPGGYALLKELPTSGRLVELDTKDEQARATLVKLSIMTKQLMQKLANEGQRGFRSSIERMVSTSGPLMANDRSTQANPWLDRFANGVPPDLFRAAWNEWFENGSTVPMVSQNPSPSLSHVRLSASIRSVDDDLLGKSSKLNPGDDSLLLNDPSNLLDSQGLDSQGQNAPPSERFKDSRAWDQLAFGGWMIDRQRMAIVYVPSGHADGWLSRWIELEEMRPHENSVTNDGGQNKIAMAKQCRQCHSLQAALKHDQPLQHDNWTSSFRQANKSPLNQLMFASADGSNACWKAKSRAANLSPITKFDHTPHLTLPKISDCRSCHQLESFNLSGSTDLVTKGSTSPHEPHGEFAPMQKAQCAGCHQPNAAGESCTQCHNYHVGITGWLTKD